MAQEQSLYNVYNGMNIFSQPKTFSLYSLQFTLSIFIALHQPKHILDNVILFILLWNVIQHIIQLSMLFSEYKATIDLIAKPCYLFSFLLPVWKSVKKAIIIWNHLISSMNLLSGILSCQICIRRKAVNIHQFRPISSSFVSLNIYSLK